MPERAAKQILARLRGGDSIERDIIEAVGDVIDQRNDYLQAQLHQATKRVERLEQELAIRHVSGKPLGYEPPFKITIHGIECEPSADEEIMVPGLPRAAMLFQLLSWEMVESDVADSVGEPYRYDDSKTRIRGEVTDVWVCETLDGERYLAVEVLALVGRP